jgi:hypothetical protein
VGVDANFILDLLSVINTKLVLDLIGGWESITLSLQEA